MRLPTHERAASLPLAVGVTRELPVTNRQHAGWASRGAKREPGRLGESFPALAVGLALFLTGCMGYKVGPTNGLAAGSRSVQIDPPVNRTFEPRLSEVLNRQLRQQIQRDGTYKLNTRQDGDVVVSITILRYQRFGETFQPTDALTVRDYTLGMTAKVTAYDRVSGKNLVDREFNGRTTIRLGSDQTAAERQALPLLTEDLARHITSALADGDW